jgi:flap endonuclease-1
MGIRGLTSYLRQYFRIVDTAPENLRIGVDALSILYKYKGHHEELFHCLRYLKKLGYTLFFVYDGRAPAEKESEVAHRAEVRDAPLKELEALRTAAAASSLTHQEQNLINQRVRDLTARSWHMTREMHNKIKGDLWREEIPYLKAVGEADAVLVDMYKHGKIDVILSSDMDYLMAGVGRIWVPMYAAVQPAFEEINLATVLAGERMTMDEFLEVCILCGTDETKALCRMEPERAFSYIRYYGSIKNMIRLGKEFIPAEFTEEFIAGVKGRVGAVSEGPWSRARPDHLARLLVKGLVSV